MSAPLAVVTRLLDDDPATAAERRYLSAILAADVLTAEDLDLVPGDFGHERHRHVFAAVLDLVRRSEVADLRTVAEELRRRDRLEVVGVDYLSELTDVPTEGRLPRAYLQAVKSEARRRALEVDLAVAAEDLRTGVDAADVAANIGAALGRVETGESVTYEWLPTPPLPPRPILADAAFHGLAGRIVKMIAPHTEADPFGVLACFLVTFGVVVGRGPHVRVGADRHGANLFLTLVGGTSEGRKGTADSEARRPFRLAGAGCVPPSASGLSSGEGFVYAIRDEVRTVKPIREKGRVVDHEEVVEDPGVSDKRLLVTESELASVLARMAREGNTLSALMRQAWDGIDLSTLTKKPVKATDPHVGLIAQTTPAELGKLLSETETLNGWGNRMTFASVQRPHLLPFGGSLRDQDLLPLALELKDTIELVSGFGEMERDNEANAAWKRAYPLLTVDRPGLFGAITARAPQQVIRLSLIYALLDRARMIGAVHLRAALAFWKASQESARVLFGGALGDTVADDLLVELRERPDGMTRNQMMEMFKRNVSSGRIKLALDLLARLGLAAGRKETTGGRPAERWFDSQRLHEINEGNEKTPPGTGNPEEVSSFISFNSSGREKSKQPGGVS
jgi:hypothetical protein